MGEAFFYYFLSEGVVVGREAFDECHSPAEHGDVAPQYSFDHVRDCRQGFASGSFSGVWVYGRWLGYAAVDGQYGVTFIVLRMFHVLRDYMLSTLRYYKLGIIKVTISAAPPQIIKYFLEKRVGRV